VSSQEDVNVLREDLKGLFKWSVDWIMLFNLEKCKVVHFGKNNPKEVYSFGGITLKPVQYELDLGIIVQSDLKVSKQCAKVVKTANRVLGMINRTFIFKTKETILQLYKSLVRPHLEYSVQAWSPHLKKDIFLLEKVQRRATKMIGSLRRHSYEERLSILKLTTLETRRLRGDLIEVFKIMHNLYDVNYRNFFTLANNNLRGHSLKLSKQSVKLDCGKYFFTNRIIDEWNLLTEDIVSCNTVNSFKNKIDHHLRFSRGFI